MIHGGIKSFLFQLSLKLTVFSISRSAIILNLLLSSTVIFMVTPLLNLLIASLPI